MTKRADYKIPDTDFRMPMPAEMPADMPAIMREFRREPPLLSDGSPLDDMGEELFDAIFAYFGVDTDDLEAMWNLTFELLWLLLPGNHMDPRSRGGRAARDADELAELGKIWIEMKREANSGSYKINPSSVYKTNEAVIRASSKLFKTVSPGKPSLNLLAKAEKEFREREFRRNSLDQYRRKTDMYIREIRFIHSTKTQS